MSDPGPAGASPDAACIARTGGGGSGLFSVAGGPNGPTIRPARRRYAQIPDGVRLLIIDSRSLTRDCLVAAITRASGIATIEAAPDVPAALALIRAGAAPDAILVNFSGDPLSEDVLATFLEPLRVAAPDAGLLMLAASVDRSDVLTALRQGVAGLLDSDAPFELVVEAIRLVATGLTIYPAFDLRPELRARAETNVDRLSGFTLTDRQKQVLKELLHGYTNGRIAANLAVSERTVKAHLKEIMRRLGASNRTQIVALISQAAAQSGTGPNSTSSN